MLYAWRKKARAKGRLLPHHGRDPEGWTPRGKFSAVLETALLSGVELAEYHRQRGLTFGDVQRPIRKILEVSIDPSSRGRDNIAIRKLHLLFKVERGSSSNVAHGPWPGHTTTHGQTDAAPAKPFFEARSTSAALQWLSAKGVACIGSGFMT